VNQGAGSGEREGDGLGHFEEVLGGGSVGGGLVTPMNCWKGCSRRTVV